MKSDSTRQTERRNKYYYFKNRLIKVLGNENSKYFIKLFLFVFLYKTGEYLFNFLETKELLSGMINNIYYSLSGLITNISVSLYTVFYAEIYSDSKFIIIINNIKTIQMMHGCTGFMQLFQIFFILLFFPLNVRKKIMFIPVSFIIIMIASVLHYIILVPIAYSYPDSFTIFHNIISRVVFYTFFFINFLLWNNAST